MCIFPREQNHFARLFSREAHISVKKKRWLWHTSAFLGKNIYYRSDLLLRAETLVTVSPCEFPPRCHPSSSSPHPSLSSPRPVVSEVEPRRGSPFLSPCHPGPTYLSSPLSFWSAAIESRGSPLFPRISWFFIWHFRKFYIDYRQTTFSKKFRHEKAFP